MRKLWLGSILIVLAGLVRTAMAQANTGELRLHITDIAGHSLRASITIASEGNAYLKELFSGESGDIDLKTLPYGLYEVRVESTGFAPASAVIAIRSELPMERTMELSVAPVTTTVKVSDAATLVDPGQPSSIMQIGSQQIADRVSSLPGRSVQDLVNTQPGWLYEGNAVLHPRGSEYQTQFVVDGIPLTDNRSPSFGPEIEADDVASMSIYTAGIPAEYGRKMGGVVELNTRRDTASGLHGLLILAGGSYDTADAFGQVQELSGKNLVSASASGSMTSHYLNPVVPENFTNTGTTGDFSAGYERDLSGRDWLSFSVRHDLARFLIPNEMVQEQAGQIQNGDTIETMGMVRYQHIFSPQSLGTLAGMVRDNADDLYSNASSTPIIAFQHNDFREGYFKGIFSFHQGCQDFKAGVESDSIFLHEHFNYTITDPTQFDDNTPSALTFADTRPDLEQ